MYRRLTLVVSLLVVAAALAAPAFSQSGAWPRTIADDTGTKITLAAKPRKIVSATLPTDEILLSLVDRSKLAAVSSFAVDAGVSNVAQQAVPVPLKLAQLNAEVVISLKPDIVFVADWSDAASVKQLRDAGVPVFEFKSPLTVKQVEDTIMHLGTVVGEEDAARKLTLQMDTRLAAVAAKVGTIPAQKRLSVMDYSTYGTSLGTGSSWDEIIRLAGLRDAVGDLTTDQYGSVTLSKEKVLTIDPDILMLPSWVYGDPKGSDAFYTAITGDPALKGLKAVKQGRVQRMPESLKTATSQYIVDAIEYLARYAYPDLFR